MIRNIENVSSYDVNKSHQNIAQSLERITSGNKLKNSGNVADIAISSKLNTQYNDALIKAQTAQNEVSYLQSRDQALGLMTENVQKLRDLAVQHGSPILSDEDKTLIRQEAGNVIADIDQIEKTAAFNGIKVVSGVTTAALGLDKMDLGSDLDITEVDNALFQLNSARIGVGVRLNAVKNEIEGLRQDAVNAAISYDRVAALNPLEEFQYLKDEIRKLHIGIYAVRSSMNLDASRVMSLIS